MSIFEEYGAFKGTGYTYPPFLQGVGRGWGEQFCYFLVAALHTNPVGKRSTLKGKNLLPRGANSFI